MTSIFNLQAPKVLKAEQTTIKDFVAAWRGRQLYTGQGLNDPHVAKVAFRTLGLLAAATAVTFLILGLCSIVVVTPYIVIPICVLTSIFSFMRTRAIHA